MTLDILCTPKFSKQESKMIAAASASLGISREEFVRRAVKDFSAKCVPTHLKKSAR